MSLTGAAIKVSLQAAAKKLAARMPSARTSELFDEMVQEAALNAEGFLLKLVERMGGDPEQAAERLAQTVTEQEYAAFQARLLPELLGSPSESRRKLLAAALAGVYSPDFSLEAKSRITRAISMLEPSDVAVLRMVEPVQWMYQGGGSATKTVAPWQTRVAWGKPTNEQLTSFAALVAAGCITESTHDGELVRDRTPLGSAVLAYLVDWERSETVSSPETPSGASTPRP